MNVKVALTRAMADILFRTGLIGPVTTAVGYVRGGSTFPILAFHRVNDDDDPFMPALPTGLFAARMEHIARYYDVLPVDELVDRLHAGRLPRKALALTFDDGYRDNLTHAAPVLARYGLPATVFLTTGLIGTQSVAWFDRLALALKATTRRELSLEGRPALPLRSTAERLQALQSALRHLKRRSDAERRAGVERIVTDLDGRGLELPKHLMLTWDEAAALRGLGISIGAHTVTHPILSRLSPEEAWYEINGSKEAIERGLGLTPRAFAYPNGGREDCSETVVGLVARAGFSCAVTTQRGLNTRRTPLMELRRGGPWERHLPTYALKLAHYRLTGA